MSGVHGHVYHHLGRRVADAVLLQARSFQPGADRMQQLQHDAELYENAGPQMEIRPAEMIPVVITGLIVLLIIASVRYTIGEVMASLCMIESPSSIAIVEDKPPAYTDLDKDPLIPAEADADVDVEVTVINTPLISAKITTMNGALFRAGGFFARWRGFGLSFLYHALHAVLTHFIGSFLIFFGPVGLSIGYILVSVGLARLHMAWTHSMIAHPSSKPFWRRIVPRKQAKAVLLPSLVFAVAQQATFLIPLLVASLFSVPFKHGKEIHQAVHEKDCGKLAFAALAVLSVLTTALVLVFRLLLPALVTLTRIEASLLPEGEETIVPFDREAVTGGVDPTVRHGCKALFAQVWRSVDRATQWRLIKLYLKMALVQFTVAFTGLHLMLAEVYVIGGERIGLIVKSGIAQLKLMAIEAHQERH